MVQKCPPGPPPPGPAAAVDELAAALRLLSACCMGNPQMAVDLLHVEVPVGAAEGGQRGPDLLSLACHAAAVLARLPKPPTDAIGEPAEALQRASVCCGGPAVRVVVLRLIDGRLLLQ